jgi:hypothetical protein
VRLPAARVADAQRSAAVAGLGPPQVPWPDAITSQGVYRTGADALQSAGLTGKDVRVAVLDLGFGANWQAQVGRELPPPEQIDAV